LNRTLNRPDPRELPAYTVREAARYLLVPAPTVRYWSVGRDTWLPLIDVPAHDPVLLSFINLVELHVLASIRRKHRITMPKVREAIDWLRQQTADARDRRHPLISRQLETDGLDLFTERYGQLININRDGQFAMRELMSGALRRIERDAHGIPIKLYPYTRSSVADAPSMIVIDPTLSGGRPVLAGTGLATEMIAERYKAGESVEDLAKDYERKESEIDEAIRCELGRAA